MVTKSLLWVKIVEENSKLIIYILSYFFDIRIIVSPEVELFQEMKFFSSSDFTSLYIYNKEEGF